MRVTIKEKENDWEAAERGVGEFVASHSVACPHAVEAFPYLVSVMLLRVGFVCVVTWPLLRLSLGRTTPLHSDFFVAFFFLLFWFPLRERPLLRRGGWRY